MSGGKPYTSKVTWSLWALDIEGRTARNSQCSSALFEDFAKATAEQARSRLSHHPTPIAVLQ
jgi:hypothetical protein